jgi:hypothetical protein
MKKALICLFVFISMLIGFTTFVYAQETPDITANEQDMLAQLMDIRGIGGDITAYVLFSHTDDPQFIIGSSEAGYLIMDRDCNGCMEWGTGRNPYNDFQDKKKYYGGISCYFVELEDQYYNIISGEKTDVILYVKNLDKVEKSRLNSYLQQNQTLDDPPPTITETKRINNCYSSLQRLAFGINSDGTCTAVACGIVLNYLDREVSTLIVPSDMESEVLKTAATDDLMDYPQAEALHQYLYHECGMNPVNLAWMVTDEIAKYRQYTAETENTEIAVSWCSFTDSSYITSEIDQDIPSMVTTLIWGDTDTRKHTMAVYGYRIYSDDSCEILVHRGWSGDIHNGLIDEHWYPIFLQKSLISSHLKLH